MFTSLVAAQSPNIVELIQANKDFSTFVTVLKASKMVQTLEGKGPFTVFAPSNYAFSTLPKDVLDTLLHPKNITALNQILESHVVSGSYTTNDLARRALAKIKTLRTLAGGELSFSTADGQVIISYDDGNHGGIAPMADADYSAFNGMVHLLDNVMVNHDTLQVCSQQSHDASSIKFFHWNPHYQCFHNKAGPQCEETALDWMHQTLNSNSADFISLIEAEVSGEGSDFITNAKLNDIQGRNYVTEAQLLSTCKRDVARIVYDENKWTLDSTAHGCFVVNDRSYVAAKFQPKGGGDPIVVISAHFPHAPASENLQHAGSMGSTIKALGSGAGMKLIMMADTNVDFGDGGWTDSDILTAIDNGAGGSFGHTTASGMPETKDYKTCCSNSNFFYSFDRIVNNFDQMQMNSLWGTENPPTVPQTIQYNPQAAIMHRPLFGTVDV